MTPKIFFAAMVSSKHYLLETKDDRMEHHGMKKNDGMEPNGMKATDYQMWSRGRINGKRG